MLRRALSTAARVPTRNVGRMTGPGTAFFLCDIQERFSPLIYGMDSVVRTADTMCRFAQLVDAPLVATEQYPKAFGRIVPPLQHYLQEERNTGELKASGHPAPVFEKSQFSMVTPEVRSYLDKALSQHNAKLERVILFGIETHVCVQQTCMDLIAEGVDVHVLVDGCSSQRVLDRSAGLKRMESMGAFLTTVESAMFGVMGDAAHPKFKDMSKLLKEHNETPTNLDHF